MNTDIPKDYAKENNEKSLMFACQWGSCSQMFASISELSSHLDLTDIPFNSNDGKWVCKWTNCSKSNHVFRSRYRLVRHMLIHTGAKPHACDICPKTFARRENLKIHKRIHTGEKPFPCRDISLQRKLPKTFLKFFRSTKARKKSQEQSIQMSRLRFRLFHTANTCKASQEGAWIKTSKGIDLISSSAPSKFSTADNYNTKSSNYTGA